MAEGVSVQVDGLPPAESPKATALESGATDGGRVLRLFVPVTEGRVHRVGLGERPLAEEIARSCKDRVVKPSTVLEVLVPIPEGFVVAGEESR